MKYLVTTSQGLKQTTKKELNKLADCYIDTTIYAQTRQDNVKIGKIQEGKIVLDADAVKYVKKHQ